MTIAYDPLAIDALALALALPPAPVLEYSLPTQRVRFMSSCGNDSTAKGPQQTWSKKDTTNWLFHPFGAPEDTTDLKAVRASIENRSSTGAYKSRVAYRLTNDGATFEDPVSLYANGASEQPNDGTTYGATFVDLSAAVAGKQLIQWGAQGINSSGTATEMAMTTIKIDRKKG